jgi:hypothetical protein
LGRKWQKKNQGSCYVGLFPQKTVFGDGSIGAQRSNRSNAF